MKFKLVLIILVIILTGCSGTKTTSESNSQPVKEKTEIVHESDNNVTSSDIVKPKSLDKKFIPPNFLVKEFTVKSSDKKMEVILKYQLSDDLNTYLKDNVKFLFNVEFSDILSNDVGVSKTNTVEGLVGHDGELSHTVILTANLQNEINPSLKEMINNDEMRFRLIIYDEFMVAVHIFEDVQWADSFVNGESQHIILDDTK
ncbi:hypothetical protein [Ureibacillus acetophenoni]|uniref:hypothetical protein n=1 Tax=Ureibacillus acetophenoni TaxID=614649 RepID=UPI0014831D41|nr:hypothetical protein [Ureibacillus acetophenoni]